MDDKHHPEGIHVTSSPAPEAGAQRAERLIPYKAVIVQVAKHTRFPALSASLRQSRTGSSLLALSSSLARSRQYAKPLHWAIPRPVAYCSMPSRTRRSSWSAASAASPVGSGWDGLVGLRSRTIFGFLIGSFCRYLRTSAAHFLTAPASLIRLLPSS